MSWSQKVRQTHRWLSIAFTVAVIVNIVAMVDGDALKALIVDGLGCCVLPWSYMQPEIESGEMGVIRSRFRERSAKAGDHCDAGDVLPSHGKGA